MRKADKTADHEIPVQTKFDVEMLAAMTMKVRAEGFVTAEALQAEFGPAKFTQGIAILFRQYRVFRETRRPWKEGEPPILGYEWADVRFSKAQQSKIPPALGFLVEMTAGPRTKYGDYERVTVQCRWIVPILGSVPIKDLNEDPTNCFERDHLGRILILRYHQRAMAAKALPLIGKEVAIARKIPFSVIRIEAPTIKIVEHGIVSEYTGGKGLRRSEEISDGLAFTIRAMVPTSVLSVAQFLEMLRLAGQYIGLSPARSAGFGDFEVVGAE